jgi:hypothetical protein
MILGSADNYPLDYTAYLHNSNDHSANIHRREILKTSRLHSGIKTISYVHHAYNAAIPQNQQTVISFFLAMLIQCLFLSDPAFFFLFSFMFQAMNYVCIHYTPEFLEVPSDWRYILVSISIQLV